VSDSVKVAVGALGVALMVGALLWKAGSDPFPCTSATRGAVHFKEFTGKLRVCTGAGWVSVPRSGRW
jgi:hypothetical protein